MTDPPATPLPAASLRLATLGTLALVNARGDMVLGAHGHHRRRLALLAVLAAAGERGRSRDQLLLLFWPEATQARARHSLDQLLYALRSSLDDRLFDSVNPVRLNVDVVPSDVAAFAAAVERGDPAAAVDLYRGPFLDGFHLGDAPDFERWMDEERARLAGRHLRALERLARDAGAVRAHDAAAAWWARLTDAEPLSSRFAAAHVRALADAGDTGAALQHARRYQALVARELGVRADPAIASLVEELRLRGERPSGAPDASLVTRRAPEPEPRVASASDDAVPHPVATARTDAVRLPRRGPRGRRAWLAGVALASLALLAVAATATLRRPPGPAGPPGRRDASLVVLPLTLVGGDTRDAALVDGLSDELIALVARSADVRVIARTSAFAFAGSDVGARRIADSLGVAHALEGSVERRGARLRVHVRLVRAADGAVPWSATYERELTDAFAMQREIAVAVVGELDARRGDGRSPPSRRAPTTDVVAYELYLRGRDPIRLRATSESSAREGLQLLQEAVARDPAFAAAYASMPYRYWSLAGFSRDVPAAARFHAQAMAAARTALAIDSTLPEAHVALAVAHTIHLPDFAASEDALRRAIALGGAPQAREHLARVLMWSGRHAEALVESRRAAADDPLSPSATADLGEALCAAGRVDEGFAQLARVASLRPPLRRASLFRAECHAMRGQWAETIAELRGATDPRARALVAYALARSGATDEARRQQAAVIAGWRRSGRGAIAAAIIAEGLGERDDALAWLAHGPDDLALTGLVMFPLFAALHAEPRFDELRPRLGVARR